MSRATAERLACGFLAVALTGPTQCGQTALTRQLLAGKPYRTLEAIDTHLLAIANPRAFLAQFSAGAALDDIQRAPQLWSYLQGALNGRGIMGDFVITGSQQFGLLEPIYKSLAERVGLNEFLPLSLAEMMSAQSTSRIELNDLMFKGGYPA